MRVFLEESLICLEEAGLIIQNLLVVRIVTLVCSLGLTIAL